VEVLRRYSKLPVLPIISQTGRLERQQRPSAKPPRRVRRRLTPAAIQQLCAHYQAGSSTRELATRYGLSKTAATALLREREIPIRRQGLSDQQVRQAVQLYEAGSSVVQVARTMNLPASSIYDALQRASVVMRARHSPGRRRSCN
jgi:transposase